MMNIFIIIMEDAHGRIRNRDKYFMIKGKEEGEDYLGNIGDGEED